MDLRIYYQKIREIEQTLTAPAVVVVSHETQDGGRAGVCTEVPRLVAARMILESLARLATAEEAQAFQEQKAEAKHAVEQQAAASRMQVTLVPAGELRNPKLPARASKD